MWAVHQFAEHNTFHWAERKCLLAILERLGVQGQVYRSGWDFLKPLSVAQRLPYC